MPIAIPWGLFALSLLLASSPAQGGAVGWPDPAAEVLREAPVAARDAKWTLWVGYPDDRSGFADHASWLRDLQERMRERGLRVVVATSAEAAARIAESDPGFGVASERQPQGGRFGQPACALVPAGGQAATVFHEIDFCIDRVEAALDGELERTAPDEADQEVQAALNQVGDGADVDAIVAHCTQCLPRSGLVRGLAVLQQWWAKGDHAAAREQFAKGLAALDGTGPSLVVFADLVLRGDSTDPGLARPLAVALAPAAAAAPDGAFTQMVYLRALLRAGQDRQAARVAERLPALVASQPLLRLWLAETLMEAKDPHGWRDLANRLLEPAPADETTATGPMDLRMRSAARHKILVACGGTEKEREEVYLAYRRGDTFGGSLNNDAWYMVTDWTTMGRFPSFALAHADEMAKTEGERLDYGSKDTVALVAFCNGQFARAVELQRQALADSGGSPFYQARLRRFEGALARQEAERARKAEKGR